MDHQNKYINNIIIYFFDIPLNWYFIDIPR